MRKITILSSRNTLLLLFAVAFFTLFNSMTINSQSELLEERHLVFPTLDQQLVRLWIASHDQDTKNASDAIDRIKEEWIILKEEIKTKNIEHINIKDFNKGINDYVNALPTFLVKKKFSSLKSISYHLLYEFRSLRQCLFKTEYSMDILWESMDAYILIKNTVEDRMFNLKEWFEFEDDINEFICKWEQYDLKSIQEIQSYYPGIKKIKHSQLKQKVNSCIVDLLNSVETGYQNNFVLPCDDLGDALEDLMRYYANSSMKLLM